MIESEIKEMLKTLSTMKHGKKAVELQKEVLKLHAKTDKEMTPKTLDYDVNGYEGKRFTEWLKFNSELCEAGLMKYLFRDVSDEGDNAA